MFKPQVFTYFFSFKESYVIKYFSIIPLIFPTYLFFVYILRLKNPWEKWTFSWSRLQKEKLDGGRERMGLKTTEISTVVTEKERDIWGDARISLI